MSKAVNKNVIDQSHFCKSSFILTFAVEIVGIDVWHDCNEGWLDLGSYLQGMKIQYQLYPGQSFELDILIWPHVAKIWCGNKYGFVRTWQFLERRWLAFSIRHAFPVRVLDFLNHVATVTPTMGSGALSNNAKNDKNVEAFLPPLKFCERRYFGSVLEEEQTLENFIQEFIWNLVEEYIPASCFDGTFDTPHYVTDQRHQDTILFYVQETILSRTISTENEEIAEPEEATKLRDRRESKVTKDKEKKKIVDTPKVKFEINLSGDSILAGTGRIVAFETVGERPSEQSEVIVLISTNNLPAQDDVPIIFVNIDNLYDAPTEEFKKNRINQIYTQWKLGDEIHYSEMQNVKLRKPFNLKDHHTLPLSFDKAFELMSGFLDLPFEIELRGLLNPICYPNSVLFGNDKNDRNFGFAIPERYKYEEQDVLIAVAKVDAKPLARTVNGLVRGDFPLFPPKVTFTNLNRQGVCTNDINAIRLPIKPDIVIQPSVILEAQMTLEVSIGLVGCRPRDFTFSYSRLYCFVHNRDAVKAILMKITKINEDLLYSKTLNELLTGFALDTGDTILLYLEGQRDGPILKIWELTADFHPEIKTLFSCLDRYLNRIYPEMVSAAVPFDVIKMYVPLNSLLACPSIYVKPALPLPARSAILKIGRLISSQSNVAPCRNEMPTSEELKSFKLELCVPPLPEHNIDLKK